MNISIHWYENPIAHILSKEGGVSIKDAPSSFILRNIGMSLLNLEIKIE